MPNLGTAEVIIILAIVVLLFGAKRLPELARGSGRALRIFKTEVKGLTDDDDESTDVTQRPSAIERPTTPESDEDRRAAEAKREQG
ncbi:twin arginine-targeting protein translocase, TatA/E family [Aeromicrobium marinum DSM 15272]|uniref:Sec-independent protein translocase protein TatA n=1 Tax=Aeromicrobium marinum DSM 15272 TaxID=585531 RepID=E2S9V3_9ACTN|nr:Sec-independent protein translocase subunit TatA [Aeromicrobium marinum]EFQ84027.1 twin arginine-targeting protein translocase, TatA/E family [Aeromicrobium marinum DSM 15272]